jgi:hypothetical protein
MPFLPGHGGSDVPARKVRDVLAVPAGEEMTELSRCYPRPCRCTPIV